MSCINIALLFGVFLVLTIGPAVVLGWRIGHGSWPWSGPSDG